MNSLDQTKEKFAEFLGVIDLPNEDQDKIIFDLMNVVFDNAVQKLIHSLDPEAAQELLDLIENETEQDRAQVIFQKYPIFEKIVAVEAVEIFARIDTIISSINRKEAELGV